MKASLFLPSLALLFALHGCKTNSSDEGSDSSPSGGGSLGATGGSVGADGGTTGTGGIGGASGGSGGASTGGGTGTGGMGGEGVEGASDDFGPCTEAPIFSKLLVLIYNPYHKSTESDEASTAESPPIATTWDVISELKKNSHGFINYQWVETIVVNGMPPKLDEATPGSSADYAAIFSQHGLAEKVSSHEIDEIWIWGPSGAGLDEFAYKVPEDAIPYQDQIDNPWFYDLRKKTIPDTGRTVWVMGFNYNVGLANAIHSYGHRIESILSIMVGKGKWTDAVDPENPWRKFSLTDVSAPGQAGVGTVHEPANGTEGYDYSNTNPVTSTANDWLNYPNLTGATESITCDAWDCSELGYHEFYQQRLPHAVGATDGVCNNWWTYIANYDRNLSPCEDIECGSAQDFLCEASEDCASDNCECGVCRPTGESEVCGTVDFEACSEDSACDSSICGCTGDTEPSVCLPNAAYADTCLRANGLDCISDEDCISDRCGCDGGSVLHCLEEAESTTCANIENWQKCRVDGDCTSGVCGCNGGAPPSVCLPSEAYPRTCVTPD